MPNLTGPIGWHVASLTLEYDMNRVCYSHKNIETDKVNHMLSVLISGAAADSRLAQNFALDRRKK